mmetsp:Transcript_7699/g.20670  ORF Transcript_7699/g.20670 Transcript_7699/m.20670 type:complete len:352 (-) Transcript_7699:354-1409(-)
MLGDVRFQREEITGQDLIGYVVPGQHCVVHTGLAEGDQVGPPRRILGAGVYPWRNSGCDLRTIHKNALDLLGRAEAIVEVGRHDGHCQQAGAAQLCCERVDLQHSAGRAAGLVAAQVAACREGHRLLAAASCGCGLRGGGRGRWRQIPHHARDHSHTAQQVALIRALVYALADGRLDEQPPSLQEGVDGGLAHAGPQGGAAVARARRDLAAGGDDAAVHLQIVHDLARVVEVSGVDAEAHLAVSGLLASGVVHLQVAGGPTPDLPARHGRVDGALTPAAKVREVLASARERHHLPPVAVDLVEAVVEPPASRRRPVEARLLPGDWRVAVLLHPEVALRILWRLQPGVLVDD